MEPETRPTSVIVGKDWDALGLLLNFHVRVPDPLVIDVTYNQGRMWTGLEIQPVRMDLDPQWNVDVVGDFRAIPFPEGTFDVVVFDPPHLPNAGHSATTCTDWETRYGITPTGREGDNVSDYFQPFLLEAKRVLKPNGLVIAKIADLVHNHRYQWQHVDFIQAARGIPGLTPCDCLIKRDPLAGRLNSGRWEKAHHLRKAHSYWIVVRNSPRCE